ncbi:hypothetical protein SDC9_04070 [bioreactor metagenome]|uniref:Spore germination protein YndE n=1 Tax=bioreactor metagenome TaxID=1076179 RepID=A0A644SV54_9ZZZZ|nr:GerAB/ArcD/ProY family transporter [Negativicutes bacterium]
MSYQTGQMGVAAGISLIYMITIPFVFLSTSAQTIEQGAGAAWLIPLVSGVAGIVMLVAMTYVLSKFPGDLYTVCRKLLGQVGAWIVALYYVGLFFCDSVLILRQFAENTLLTALPNIEFSVVVLLYIAVAAVVIYPGLEGVVRSNYIIMPFSISALILVVLLLIPSYNYYNLLPWQGTGLEKVIPVGLIFAGAGAGSFAIIILAPAFQSAQTMRQVAIWGLGLSTILKVVTVLGFSLTFGNEVAREKVLPFFEMARLVYLSRYIQHIEALFIILWVVAGVFALAINFYMGLYLITRLLNLPTMRPLIPIVGIFLAQIAMMPPDITTVLIWDGILISTYFNIGLYGIPTVIIAAASFKQKKGRGTKC